MFVEPDVGDLLALTAEESTTYMPDHTHMANALPRARDVELYEPWLVHAFVVACYPFGRFAIQTFN